MMKFISEWIVATPTHLTESEALQRAAESIQHLDWDDTSKGELLCMVMLYWSDRRNEVAFKARFWDWKKM